MLKRKRFAVRLVFSVMATVSEKNKCRPRNDLLWPVEPALLISLASRPRALDYLAPDCRSPGCRAGVSAWARYEWSRL